MPERFIHVIGSLNRVRPEFEERYTILHKHTFPEVLWRIKRSNIKDYSIFLLEGMLFSYFVYDGDDYEADMKAIADDKTTQEWWKLTDPMQLPLPGRLDTEWWATMEVLAGLDHGTRQGQIPRRIVYKAEIINGSEEILRGFFHLTQWPSAFTELDISISKLYAFLGHGNLCLYAEYVGAPQGGQVPSAESLIPFSQRDAELREHLKTTWREMKEVFHTN
jgi:L-rhamnose mutarotase